MEERMDNSYCHVHKETDTARKQPGGFLALVCSVCSNTGAECTFASNWLAKKGGLHMQKS